MPGLRWTRSASKTGRKRVLRRSWCVQAPDMRKRCRRRKSASDGMLYLPPSDPIRCRCSVCISHQSRQAPPDFLKNVDMDNVLSSKENFNQLLVSVYNQAISDAERTITPRITEVAHEQISRKMETRQALDNFYSRNPEFSNRKDLIAMAVRHIRQRNIDIQDPGEILKGSRKICV